MNEWHPLEPLDMPEWVGEDVRDTGEKANVKIAQLNENRKQCDALRNKVLHAPMNDDYDVDPVFEGQTAAASRLMLLSDELEIRKTLDRFYWARFAEYARAEADRLYGEIDKAKAELVKALHGLGYVGDGSRIDNSTPGTISPPMLRDHPKVQAAHGRYSEIRALAHDIAPAKARANAAAIKEIEKQIASARQRAVSV